FRGISLSAVAAVLLIVLLPSGMSAKEVLAEAIKAFSKAENIEMTVDIRTRPVENFRFIDINENFIGHHIDIMATDSLLRWRIDKGDRIAIGNGRDIYTWLPKLNIGWHLSHSDNENVLGYMANLLSPQKILETELTNCLDNEGAEFTVKKDGKHIILTVHADPEGNFENPYSLNTSIFESENIRKYIIDADSKRLMSATVSIKVGKREIEVLKISDITYDMKPRNICRLPEDIQFIEMEKQLEGLKNLTAEEAATTILNAFADWNESILSKVVHPNISEAAYRKRFSGSKLISIGQSFTSGANNSIFVPYTLELKDGTVQRHNIALQKNDSGGWTVVGGL
ncbi:MAG: hypothetical protein K2J78_03795, partial [Muribaculaceae bacterium]|nr:hypothetical protein [Muribaculaceae bacterium]